jgi:hypothetical protein
VQSHFLSPLAVKRVPFGEREQLNHVDSFDLGFEVCAKI